MMNELKYKRQVDHYSMMNYMSVAFATVMAAQSESGKVTSASNKLKPEHLFQYVKVEEEKMEKELEKMESHFNFQK